MVRCAYIWDGVSKGGLRRRYVVSRVYIVGYVYIESDVYMVFIFGMGVECEV